MKSKQFLLGSGNIDSYYWKIVVNIRENESFLNKGNITLCGEKEKEYQKEYYKRNRKQRVTAIKTWREENSTHVNEYHKKYNKSEKAKEAHRRYRKTKKGIENHRKDVAKRKKNLGFIPLNKQFSNADAHHIDKKHVVYMPHDLHNSVYHCLTTGENMEEINQLAMMYLA
jgi:hypothetical protein